MKLFAPLAGLSTARFANRNRIRFNTFQMSRETIEVCALCHSICRAIECTGGHRVFQPLVEVGHDADSYRAQVLEAIQDSKFCKTRIETALTMLRHLEQFLGLKGHKIMQLQVKQTLRSLEDRRADPVDKP
jgi:hypothetical protein